MSSFPPPQSNGAATLTDRVRALRLEDRLNERSAGGSTAWLPWLLCLAMAAAWVGVGSRWYPTAPEKASALGTAAASPAAPSDAAKSAEPTPAAPTPAVPTQAAPEVPAGPTGKSVLVSRGYLIPAHQISISPIEVSGRIIELAIEEGRKFNKGDVLARIDPSSYNSGFLEAEALLAAARARCAELEAGPRQEEVRQATADLAEARANLNTYRLDFDRSQGLRGSALAQREYEQAESLYRAGEQKVRKLEQVIALLTPRQERKDASRAEVKAAEARVALAKWRLDNCAIRAPVSGTILSKKAEEGNLINPVVGGVSTSLCDMADLSDLEVDLEIQERDLSKIRVGYECEVRPEAYPERTYVAYVDRAMPIANRARGILPVRLKVVVPPSEGQGEFLRPEMSVAVNFLDRPYPKPKGAAK